MSTPDGGRIRRRIAEIDQHIAVLNKERDELIFAERVLDRLSGGGEGAPAPAKKGAAASEPSGEPDSIEEALSKLESAQFKS
ncbi:MAG TPA: hypothetical protein VL899_06110 [Alphaproteobacteria bacterium]|nr:hypothetical protein [Alphaproteobacteria bacterium]